MAKKRFTDEELREAKVPKTEFDDSVKDMFKPPQWQFVGVMCKGCGKPIILFPKKKSNKYGGHYALNIDCLYPDCKSTFDYQVEELRNFQVKGIA